MASPTESDESEHYIADTETDYGSEVDLPSEEEIKLLKGQASEPIDDNPIVNEVEHRDPPRTLRLPRVFGIEERSPLFKAAREAERVAEQISEAVALREHYPNLSSRLQNSTEIGRESAPDPILSDDSGSDLRSPIERFRTKPKRSLSVTDLVSPAWCELQYWYALSLHGKKTHTTAMRQGTKIHRQLEAEVHVTVRVETVTKEDQWGLRIWNVIQGLRCLRSTGQTRELEIWGIVDGVVVNGVIDELTYECPDKYLEVSLDTHTKQAPDQTTITDFLKATGGVTITEATRAKRRAKSKKIYICDVKTRSVPSIPTIKGAGFRPTKYQLMLYHHLLSSLATNNVDFSILTTRFKLDADKIFSDTFIAQVGSIQDEVFYDAQSSPLDEPDPSWQSDSDRTLLAHNSLTALWSLMITEFQLTFPDGADSLGKVLKAEYRTRDHGEVMGSREILMDDAELQQYIGHEMKWWRGERPAEGVVIEEAYKCKSCEFAEGCEWRLAKIDEATEKARLVTSRKISSV